jgi:uncharacterized protein YgiM (DUF1202 family)
MAAPALTTQHFNRRVALKAAAAFAAMTAATRAGLAAPVRAQTEAEPVTTSLTWVEAEHPDTLPDADGSRTIELEAPFSAIAPTWSGEAGDDVLVEIATSIDGVAWSDPVTVGEAIHDAGPADRDGRRFGELQFAEGASFVRYRALNSRGEVISVPGLAFTCIDSTAGPAWADAVGGEQDATTGVWQPPIISRAAWGANESYRFDENGVAWWPLQYQEVEHVIVHHTVTPNFQDPLVAMRAIYYYHAVERGWGDIGYNYLVDQMGNVYEGRYGGENVVGGHAYQYAHGSSGIGLLGDFSAVETTPEAQAGLVWIAAWASRNLDPWGYADFHETTALPTICGHRDVLDEICPGDGLYGQLDTIRAHVADVLAGADPTITAEFYVGDTVQVIVEDANLRSGPGTDSDTLATLPWGAILTITEAATTSAGYAWYGVSGDAGWGYCAGIVLQRIAEAEIADDGFAIGDKVVVSTDMLNLRTDAGRSAPVVASLPYGTAGVVTDGPVRADGFVWHELETDYGTGWAAGVYLAARGSGVVFAVGDTVMVDTNAVVLRSGPGRSYRDLVAVPRGEELTVTDAPIRADGHDWYGVQNPDYGTGWAAGTYLSPA